MPKLISGWQAATGSNTPPERAPLFWVCPFNLLLVTLAFHLVSFWVPKPPGTGTLISGVPVSHPFKHSGTPFGLILGPVVGHWTAFWRQFGFPNRPERAPLFLVCPFRPLLSTLGHHFASFWSCALVIGRKLGVVLGSPLKKRNGRVFRWQAGCTWGWLFWGSRMA